MKISVIVPTYNVENYIDRCVASIVRQSEKDIEIILVDDGSQDKTGQKCNEWRRRDDRIKVLHTCHNGVSRARNRGIELSKGDWLRFADGDDMLSPFRLEKLLSDALDTGADMAVCGFLQVADGDSLRDVGVPAVLYPTEIISKRDFFLRLYTKYEITYVAVWNKLYRRNLFDGARYREGKIHEDEGIIHLLVDRCRKISVTGQPLYFYRKRRGSIMNRPFTPERLDIFPFLTDRMEYFADCGRKDLEFFTMKNYMVACLELYAAVPEDFPEGKVYKNHLKRMFSDMFSRAMKSEGVSKKIMLKMSPYLINPSKYKEGQRGKILYDLEV